MDAAILKKLGLTWEHMLKCDASFFYQLIFQIVNPTLSSIDGDPHMGHYEKVAKHTKMYVMDVKRRGGSCNHVFWPTYSQELLQCWSSCLHH